jgi:hypothetical protein
VSDQIDAVSSAALTDHFASRYPGYPRFARRTTRSTLEADVRVALTQIATRRPTGAGTAILESLELVDVNGTDLRADGTYAAELATTIDIAQGKVVNRSDLLQPLDPGVPVWGPWHLEPPWLMVVAAAMCQLGRLDIGVGDQRIDALALDKLARFTPEQLAEFDHLVPPKALPVAQLREVVRILDLPPGSVPDAGANDQLVPQVLTRVQDLSRRTDNALRAVGDGTELWGDRLFDLVDERAERLEHLRALLLDLKVRDSVGKLNNLAVDGADLAAAQTGKQELEHVEAVLATRDKLAQVAEYLREASGVFGVGIDEGREALELRSDMLDLLQGDEPIDPAKVVQLRNAGENLRRRFVDLASRSYRHDHLDAAQDARRNALLQGAVATLDALQTVTILAPGPLAQLRAELADLMPLFEIDEKALGASVGLPGKRPPRAIDPERDRSAAARLEACEQQAGTLLAGWKDTLADSLNEPEMTEQIGYLPDGAPKVQVEALAATRALPEPVTPVFVQALNQVFNRVDVRHISQDELTTALFPNTSPATAEQLRARLDGLLDKAIGGANPEQVRFLPGSEEAR